MEFLDNKIKGASEQNRLALMKRRQSLEARLGGKCSISPQRLQTLHLKIDRTFKRAIVRNWERMLNARFIEAWPRYLGIDHCPL